MNKYKTVDDYLLGLDASRRAQVETLRRYILDVEPSLVERIKWNAPSYAKDNEDRLTFNTVNKEQVVKLVFHMGATRQENKHAAPVLKNAEMINWVSDIRGYISFENLDDIMTQEAAFKQVVRDWLELR